MTEPHNAPRLAFAGAVVAGLAIAAGSYAATPGAVLEALLPVRAPVVLLAVAAQSVVAFFVLRETARLLAGGNRVARAVTLAAILLFVYVYTDAMRFFLSWQPGRQLVAELVMVPGLLAVLWGAAWVTDLASARVDGHPRESVWTLLHRDAVFPFLALTLALSEHFHKFANLETGKGLFLVVFVGAAAGITCASVLAGRPSGRVRLLGLVGLAAVALVLLWFDTSLHRRTYRFLHVASFLAVVVACSRFAWEIRRKESADTQPKWRRVVPFVVLGTMLLPLADARMRFELVERPSTLGRGMMLSRRFVAWSLMDHVRASHTVVHATPPPIAVETPPSIVFVSVDALRWDHLVPDRMPITHAFSDGGMRFPHAYTPYPTTRPTMRAIMSGTMSGHPRRVRGEFPADDVLLWKRLSSAGYRTAYVGLSFDRVHEAMDEVETVSSDLPAAGIVERALRHLDEFAKDDGPFAAWFHFFDAHDPYVPAAPVPGASKRDLYSACVTEADAATLPLFERLTEIAAERPLYVVFFADHGEEFGDHGGQTHGSSLYEEQVRVPFFVVGPGIRSGESDLTASLLDVTPTVLALAGLPLSDGLNGRSVEPALRGRPMPESPALFEVQPRGYPVERRGAVMGRWKIIVNFVSGTVEVYDLEADPTEMNDVHERIGETPPELRGALGL